MSKLNLKCTNLKNLSIRFNLHNYSLLKGIFGNSITRQFKPVIRSLSFIFAQYFSLSVATVATVATQLGDNFSAVHRKKSCRLSSSSFYIQRDSIPIGVRSGLLLSNNCVDKSSSVAAARYFSSTSLPNKLFINSTCDSLNFDNGKSVLIMPFLSLCNIPVVMGNDDSSSNVVIFEVHRDTFTKQLKKVIDNLRDGQYSFEFYFYTNTFGKIYDDFYILDPMFKNYLIRVNNSYGYRSLVKKKVILNNTNRIPPFLSIMRDLIGCLNYRCSYPDYKELYDINFNKDVVLVINKTMNIGYDYRTVNLHYYHNVRGYENSVSLGRECKSLTKQLF